MRYMLQFDMLDRRPRLVDYAARLDARPASKAAQARNAAIAEERGLAR